MRSRRTSRYTGDQKPADAFFKDFALVRISRLSVMPESDAERARIVHKAE